MNSTIRVTDRNKFAVAMQIMVCEAECYRRSAIQFLVLNVAKGGWPIALKFSLYVARTCPVIVSCSFEYL